MIMIRLSNDKDEYLIMICRNDNSDEDPITMIMMKRVTIVIMIHDKYKDDHDDNHDHDKHDHDDDHDKHVHGDDHDKLDHEKHDHNDYQEEASRQRRNLQGIRAQNLQLEAAVEAEAGMIVFYLGMDGES